MPFNDGIAIHDPPMEPPQLRLNTSGESVLLSECFLSIQGESSLVGTPTVFVRLYSCNLRCASCDSTYAVEGGDYREISVCEIANRVRQLAGVNDGATEGVSHVCWTGGEPLLQRKQVAEAIRQLPTHFVHTIETDGEVELTGFGEALAEKRELALVRYIMNVKCPGSGMTARKALKNLPHLKPLDEVKFVLLNRSDYEFARGIVGSRLTPAETILFSPVTPTGKSPNGLDPATLARCILDDKIDVRLQLQLHKFLWPSRKCGV